MGGEAALGIPEGTPGERPPNVVALDELESFFGGVAKRPGQAAGAKQTGLNWVKLPPNEEGAPPHCHSAEEEVFVILDGEGTLELWGRRSRATRGRRRHRKRTRSAAAT